MAGDREVTLVLDWRALASADPAAATQLLALFERCTDAASVTYLYREINASSDGKPEVLARLAAETWTLRLMSASVATKIARGEDPALEATMVKDLGNAFEQTMPELVQAAVDVDPAGPEALGLVLGHLLQVSPSFSLRGGTREILKGIIARGLGLR